MSCLVRVDRNAGSNTRRRERPWPALPSVCSVLPALQDGEVLLAAQDSLISLLGVALLKKYLLIKKA